MMCIRMNYRIPAKRLFVILLIISSFNLAAYYKYQSINADTNTALVSTQPTPILDKENFKFPNIELIDHNDQSVSLHSLFNKERNIVFAFFFTHCVSVCTTVTLTLKSIQPHLPEDTVIAMISIDPDTDTPDVLNTYANQHYIVNPNWFLLTGDKTQIVNLQKSFNAYRGNKMNHNTSLFVKKANSAVITEVKENFGSIPALLTNG